jgi:CheY-like chemotaxis protein
MLKVDKNSIQIKYLEKILAGVRRASALSKQILTFSRQREIEQEPMQINSIVKEALKLLKASLPSNIEIIQNIGTITDTIIGDPTQIYQIVMNLAANAKDAMSERGGTLAIELCNSIMEKDKKFPDLQSGKYVRFEISDTGVGIEKSIVDRIFEPYFTTKEVGKGTGLGLSVVHGIISNHKGYIYVESEIGKGTKFTIFFPSVDLSPKEDELDSIGNAVGGNENILMVDDEESIVEVNSEILDFHGYRVIKCTNSQQALTIFSIDPHKYDLIITDMTMPGLSGIELSQEIRKIRKDIPIIIWTGFSDLLNENSLSIYGIDHLIYKPTDSGELLKVVRMLLDQKKITP